MNKYKKHIFVTSLAAMFIVFIIPHFAHAETINFIDNIVFRSIFSAIGEVLVQISSMFLAISAHILDVSMGITLRIKEFIDSIPAIYIVWKAIRDISGMFIIFTLIWISLQMILDLKSPNFGDLIKNVIIAGVLINFSFFIVGIMIDASNIVSLQIYRQMMPANEQPIALAKVDNGVDLGTMIRSAIDTNGFSTIFMSSLQFSRLSSKESIQSSVGPDDKTPVSVRIIISSVAGSVMMVTTGLSFILAAIAFIARIVIFIFIIGFSPIWFASKIVPKIGAEAKKLEDLFMNQLFFMPVYLLLMYLALQIITNIDITSSGGSATSSWYGLISMSINCVFVIIMLNVPLIAALQFGAKAPAFLKNNIGAGKVWGKLGTWSQVGVNKFGAFAGRNTYGALASNLAEREGFKEMASNSSIAAMALKGVRGVAQSYDKNLADGIKKRTEFAESLGSDSGQVRIYDQRIAELRRKQSELRAQNRSDDAKKLESDIGNIKEEKSNYMNKRKEQYARSRQSIWMKINSANPEAASKIMKDVLNKKLENLNKKAEKIRPDAKESRTQLERHESMLEGQEARQINPTPKQLARTQTLKDAVEKNGKKEIDINEKVNQLEDEIAKL